MRELLLMGCALMILAACDDDSIPADAGRRTDAGVARDAGMDAGRDASTRDAGYWIYYDLIGSSEDTVDYTVEVTCTDPE